MTAAERRARNTERMRRVRGSQPRPAPGLRTLDYQAYNRERMRAVRRRLAEVDPYDMAYTGNSRGRESLVRTADTGCSANPHCLTCPLAECRFEHALGGSR